MNKKLLAGVGVLSLLTSTSGVWADNSVSDTLAHPETAYHEHEVKSDSNDMAEYGQQKKEAKATLTQTKKDYEDSLSKNGAESDVTKQAKSRYDDARKTYRKYSKKTANASKDLTEDAQKLSNDRATQ